MRRPIAASKTTSVTLGFSTVAFCPAMKDSPGDSLFCFAPAAVAQVNAWSAAGAQSLGATTCRVDGSAGVGFPTQRDLSATVLLALALTVPSGAAASAQQTQRLIKEVVVTAAKREQGVYDVPASLSVFDGTELPERDIADLVDIGKFVPNLNVTTFSAGHTSSANPLFGASARRTI